MAKILFSYVNSFMDNLIPIGPSLLSACLKKEGHDVQLFDTTFYRTREKTGDEARVESLQIKATNLADFGIKERETSIVSDFREAIDSYNPDLIAFSVVEPTHHIARQILEGIQDYKIPKIVGGIHATMASEDLIKEPTIDMICVGEGEKAIVELANKISAGEDYSDVQNLWVKKDGFITRNAVRPLVNLDELPDQDWSIYEKERFFKPMGGKIWVSGPVELARGCTYKCSFCCNAELQNKYRAHGKYPRERSIANFMSELKDKKEKFGLQYLYLVAENFLSMSDKKFDDFVEQYADIKLPFWIETRPETVNLEKIVKLSKVGCEGVSIGVEHGNENFRKKMLNRYVSNEAVIHAFDLARKSNIRVCANNIIGFPTETRELFFDTIELNRALQANNSIVNIFSPYRGTKLWDVCIDKGYLAKDRLAGDYRSDVGLNMPQLSNDEILGLQRTFPLYVRFPKEMWPKIKTAEKFDDEGNSVFKELSQLYREKYM